MWIIEKSEEQREKEAGAELPYSDEELARFGEVIFFNKLLMMEFSNRPRDNGNGIVISEYEAHTLLIIQRTSNITSTELAKILGRTKSTLSPLIYKLYTQGYITKEPNPENRREHFLNITPLGEKVCQAHHALDAHIMRYSLQELLKYCTIEEFNTFIKVTEIRNEIFSRLHSNAAYGEEIEWGC